MCIKSGYKPADPFSMEKELQETSDIECSGSGNFSSDEEKEIAKLKRELRDTQDALDVLKKAISILGK